MLSRLRMGLQKSDNLNKLQPTSKNAIVVYTKIGILPPDPTNVMIATIPSRSIFLRACGVDSWLVIGAGGIDSETRCSGLSKMQTALC